MSSGFILINIFEIIRKFHLIIVGIRKISIDSFDLSVDRVPLYSSLTSIITVKPERIFLQALRSLSLFLCTCSFIVNVLRLGILYSFPKIYLNQIELSPNLCPLESFFIHVLTCFHLQLIIFLRFYWHYYFILEKYLPTISYRRILCILLLIFIWLCLLTSPSLRNDWASVFHDEISQVCIVNYSFSYSYTFFILALTCLLPLVLIVLSHRSQMETIESRISKYEYHEENLYLNHEKRQFRFASFFILIWSFINIILLIGLHLPIQHTKLRTVLYYSQLLSVPLDLILYPLIFRSLSIITLLRSANEIYFV